MNEQIYALMISDLSEELRRVRVVLSEKGARLALAEREIDRLREAYEQTADGEKEAN